MELELGWNSIGIRMGLGLGWELGLDGDEMELGLGWDGLGMGWDGDGMGLGWG